MILIDLVEMISYCRTEAYRSRFNSDAYYAFSAQGAAYVREWRKTNTLRVIDGQK